jgi:hypothetical protein
LRTLQRRPPRSPPPPCAGCYAFTAEPISAGSEGHFTIRLGPGLWIDQTNAAHWSIPELLAKVGLPSHRERITQMFALAKEIQDFLTNICQDETERQMTIRATAQNPPSKTSATELSRQNAIISNVYGG